MWELIEHKVDTFTSLKWWSTCGRWISAKRCPGLAQHLPCQLGRLRQSELISPAEMFKSELQISETLLTWVAGVRSCMAMIMHFSARDGHPLRRQGKVSHGKRHFLTAGINAKVFTPLCVRLKFDVNPAIDPRHGGASDTRWQHVIALAQNSDGKTENLIVDIRRRPV